MCRHKFIDLIAFVFKGNKSLRIQIDFMCTNSMKNEIDL